MQGRDSGAFKEALRVIQVNYKLSGEAEAQDVYADLSKTILEANGDSESPGFVRALTDPMYRGATLICIALAFTNQLTGINAINIYSTTIYQSI